TEIVLGADVRKPPGPSYKLHYEDSLGYYTYRVKRWDELNAYEKFAVQNDPRLPHFIREDAFNIRKTNPPGQITTASATNSAAARVQAGSELNPHGRVHTTAKGHHRK